MEEKGWIYQIPAGAEELHASPRCSINEGVKRESRDAQVGERVLDRKPFAREVLAVRLILILGIQLIVA